MSKTVGLISLGCSKNLVDSEVMLGLIKNNNYKITNNPEEAEVLIVNTCGFIESAQQESIETILEMAKYKKGKCEKLIVTGCLAQRYKDEIFKEIPEVDAVLGTSSYASIVKVIDENSDKKTLLYGKLENVEYLNTERVLSSGRQYAYLKIAEGCDNCCTYCIIPKLRGPYISRKIEDIVSEAVSLANQGIKEVIIVAQDITRYGIDIYGQKTLPKLIDEISKIEGIQWIRLLYAYPEEIDEEFIRLMKVNNKVCKYLDMPIQHISNKILKKMGRRGTKEIITDVIEKLRKEIPEIVLRTTFIVGFPGENESDFEELHTFVSNAKFDRVGVFTYSCEEGTPASKMENQIEEDIKETRQEHIMEIQRDISYELNNARLGNTYTTIVEGISDDGIFYTGRTYAESPDVDGVLYFTSEEPLEIGSLVEVKILNIEDYDLIGAVENELAE